MADFPFEERVYLRYLHDISEEIPNIGGMYATMPEEPGESVQLDRIGSGNQQWRIVLTRLGDDVVYKIAGFIPPDEGVIPIGLAPAWKNDGAEPGSRIRISTLDDASSYNVDVQNHDEGWIISILPTDKYDKLGVDRFAGASGREVDIVGVPVVNPPPPHPGWFVSKA
ncbi:hypothetical protein RhiLY_08301 [Ceratobasidium sp. AG-Ba]|nr:hypothetical protein RhiLY_08301 [Ceratobasidium sp. AG-Ba]